MNDHEKYLFDLNGFLVVDGVLAPDELAGLNEAVDRNPDRIQLREGRERLSGGAPALHGEHGRGDLEDLLLWPKPWCKPFRRLLAHAAVTPYLTELLGQGFRLDHLYGISMTPGTEGFVLHGGGAGDDPTATYRFHNGRMRCGLTVVSWVLTDTRPGDGGFCCIPGSHKSNYPLAPAVARLELDPGCVRQVPLRAGSVLLFTEALVHGSLPWRAAHERRALFYKYAPGSLAYAREPVLEGVSEVLDEFTPAERAVLEPPYWPDRPRLPRA